jgi:hypothetical protein
MFCLTDGRYGRIFPPYFGGDGRGSLSLAGLQLERSEGTLTILSGSFPKVASTSSSDSKMSLSYSRRFIRGGEQTVGVSI